MATVANVTQRPPRDRVSRVPDAMTTWLEVSLDAIAHNVAEVRRAVGPHPKLIAVAKADAYGHGVVGIAETLMRAGADLIAIGSIDDVARLRQAGFTGPVLLFGCCTPDAAPTVVRLRCIPTLWDLPGAEAYAAAATEPLPVAIKVDTGLHRLGVYPDDAVELAQRIVELPHLTLEGIYTHFANPIEDQELTSFQYETFNRIVSEVTAAGIEIKWAAAAASATISSRSDMLASAVDPGRLIYGFYFPPDPPVPLTLRTAARALKSRIIQLKQVEAGVSVGGYGRFFTSRETVIAVVPVGWGSGLATSAAGHADVLARGSRCPIVAVTLEHCIVDVTDAPQLSVGDEIVFFGEQQGGAIPLTEHAQRVGLSEWEVIVHFGRCLPRRYFQDGIEQGIQTGSTS